MENIKNMIFMTIPIHFDYDALELEDDKDKKIFIENFAKEVIKCPITKTVTTKNVEGEDILEDIVIGTVTDVKMTEDYNINVFGFSWTKINPEFYQVPSTEENAQLPLGKKLKVTGINIDNINEANKTFYDISKKQREITEHMSNRINEE